MPNLKTLYFTRTPNTAAVGWIDAGYGTVMKDPIYLSCEHVRDRDIFKTLGSCYHCLVQKGFMISFINRITKIEFDDKNKNYIAFPVDAKLRKLQYRVFLHFPCGETYNSDTIEELYQVTYGDMSTLMRRELEGKKL